MMKIQSLRLVISIERSLKRRDAEKVRGYLGDVFWNNPIAHHHLPNGKLLYKYPKVQYKIIKGNCLLIAFDEGKEIALNVFQNINSIFLSESWNPLHLIGLELVEEEFGNFTSPIDYLFLTPWLALNEKNYLKYKSFKKRTDKLIFLSSILNANFISIAKSLNYTVNSKIHTEIVRLKPVVVSLNNAKLLGFYASFRTDFCIPNLWGVGKSVSKGFGTVFKKDELHTFFKGILKLF